MISTSIVHQHTWGQNMILNFKQYSVVCFLNLFLCYIILSLLSLCLGKNCFLFSEWCSARFASRTGNSVQFWKIEHEVWPRLFLSPAWTHTVVVQAIKTVMSFAMVYLKDNWAQTSTTFSFFLSLGLNEKERRKATAFWTSSALALEGYEEGRSARNG